MEDWLAILERFQFSDQQERQVGNHVDFESECWIQVFNLYISVVSLFDYFVVWFDDDGSTSSNSHDASNDNELSSSSSTLTPLQVIKRTLEVVKSWQASFLTPENGWSHLPMVISERSGLTLLNRPKSEKHSFHLMLHRFISSCTSELCKYPHQLQNLQLIQEDLRQDLDFFSQFLDFPLGCLSLSSEIRAGMWIRNGRSIEDQQNHYRETNLSKMFMGLDIIAVQLGVTICGASKVLDHIMLRFQLLGRQYFVANSSPHFARKRYTPEDEFLMNDYLAFIINIVTELPLPPSTDPWLRDKDLVRRAMIQRLAAGSCTFTQIQELSHQVADSCKRNEQIFESLLRSVAE